MNNREYEAREREAGLTAMSFATSLSLAASIIYSIEGSRELHIPALHRQFTTFSVDTPEIELQGLDPITRGLIGLGAGTVLSSLSYCVGRVGYALYNICSPNPEETSTQGRLSIRDIEAPVIIPPTTQVITRQEPPVQYGRSNDVIWYSV